MLWSGEFRLCRPTGYGNAYQPASMSRRRATSIRNYEIDIQVRQLYRKGGESKSHYPSRQKEMLHSRRRPLLRRRQLHPGQRLLAASTRAHLTKIRLKSRALSWKALSKPGGYLVLNLPHLQTSSQQEVNHSTHLPRTTMSPWRKYPARDSTSLPHHPSTQLLHPEQNQTRIPGISPRRQANLSASRPLHHPTNRHCDETVTDPAPPPQTKQRQKQTQRHQQPPPPPRQSNKPKPPNVKHSPPNYPV
jgi:hypothetical protein